jgi:hypothetical protein
MGHLQQHQNEEPTLKNVPERHRALQQHFKVRLAAASDRGEKASTSIRLDNDGERDAVLL